MMLVLSASVEAFSYALVVDVSCPECVCVISFYFECLTFERECVFPERL